VKKISKFNFIPDDLPLIELLKTGFKFLKLDKLNNIFGFVYIKSSGINVFCTLTTAEGNVMSSYSSGIFKEVKRIKEKKSIHIVRQLGQLISYNAYKSNFKYLFLNIRLDSYRIRSILKNFKEGFSMMFKLNIFKIVFKRPIIRNGITLKKLPRK